MVLGILSVSQTVCLTLFHSIYCIWTSTMNTKKIQCSFENLRREMLRFLEIQSNTHPPQAEAINTIKVELERAQLPHPPPTPRRLPVFRHLRAALDIAKAGPMGELAVAFEQFEPYMCWNQSEHYRTKLGDDYMANYGYANVLGYHALIPHDRVVVAFLLIGPHRHYPRHHHEAEEIYFSFGGDTLWGQADEKPHTHLAGTPIHNTPWLPHDMTVRQTPLFTFCFWISPGPFKLPQLTG